MLGSAVATLTTRSPYDVLNSTNTPQVFCLPPIRTLAPNRDSITSIPVSAPPFSLDFNYGTGTRTIILPNGMDILKVAKIYTDLLDKYEVKYEIVEKPNQ